MSDANPVTDEGGKPTFDVILTARVALIGVGSLLGLFGIFRLLTEVSFGTLISIATWLIGAIVLHDLILSPSILGVGWLLRRFVPERPRRYLQAGLIISGLVTVIAVPMIYLRGSQPAVKALLLRNYGANLALIIGLVALAMVVLYAIRVRKDRRTTVAGSATESPDEA